MDLTQADLEELASFFGRRLDPALARTPPPADDREERRRTAAWLLVLEDAAEQGRLSALFTRIRNRHPSDTQLQKALELLLEPGSRGSSLIGVVLLAAAAAGLLLVVGAGGGGLALAWSLQDAVAPAQSLGQVAIATVDTGPSSTPARAEHAVPTGRCTRPDGGRVGYWYAGRKPPGAPGDRVTLDGAVNVRLDYPDTHNGFDTGAHIECVLQPGDVVRLSAEPIPVAGGAWWVPLATGDLERNEA